jgi:hypothetical protein
MTAYDTTFLLWTNDYRVEFFLSFSFRVLSSSLTEASSLPHVVIPRLVPVLVDHDSRRVVRFSLAFIRIFST